MWFVIYALDGRVFVCGSSKGMGEGVESALVDVAMDKGNLRREEAEEFWKKKKDGGQYIAVSGPSCSCGGYNEGYHERRRRGEEDHPSQAATSVRLLRKARRTKGSASFACLN